jgi:FkbM family methyltransferase
MELKIKKLIKKVFYKLGFDIRKVNKDINNINFDELLKDKISKNSTCHPIIIIDVGGNRGQTIERFKKIFTNPIIHSFEPVKSEFDFMYKKFKNDKNIFLNNFALGEKKEEKLFNVSLNTGNSSFNKINKETAWIKIKSKKHNTSPQDYVFESQIVAVDTLDNYCVYNKINKIHLLKIDTEGYEDKVLMGSSNSLKNNIIESIVTEVIFGNIYDKYFSLSDIEKYIKPENFRMVGIDLPNNNLYTGRAFFADIYYFNKKFYSF